MKQFLALCLLFALATTVLSHTKDEWRSRTIYQLLTDRFAKTDGDSSPCSNFGNYCGGTFKGIINNLDYIAGMGFDAIWISPVILNTPGGYHGYWAQDIFSINPNFGTADDLKNLVNACHAKDIWVMVDVVGNHMGNLPSANDFSQFNPFNDASYYHNDVDCSTINQNDQSDLETCWLAQLPDLNQDNDFVRSNLLTWISGLITTYNIDGLRIDTVPYVAKDFWSDFTAAAGVYTVGEVFNSNLPYDAGYEGPVDGILNYPYFFTTRYVFQGYNSMNNFQSYYNGASSWPDLGLLGNFVDNHDNARFLNSNGDHVAFKSALAFTLTAVGIPITYYGSEQAYGGGNDPNNREPLWTNMNTGYDIYKFLTTVINWRKQNQIWNYPQVQRYADDNFYAFTRGNFFCAFTNTQNSLSRTITYHPYSEGTVLCNAFNPTSDCVTVENNQFIIELMTGEVKLYAPKSGSEVEVEKTQEIAEEKAEIKSELEEEIRRAKDELDLLELLYENFQQ